MLKLQDFSKTYRGGKKAVSGLTLTVAPGDICGFIGRNGAGKTTTIRCIAGVLDFEGGNILVNGHSIRREPLACKQVMAYVPDNPDLYDYLTGVQYLNFIADIYEIPQNRREANIRRWADAFELTANLGDPISSYSHGMKQKLALIGALVHEPRLLLLDEPFVGLDPSAVRVFKDVMTELCASGGAVFFSTHVLDVAEKICNKVAIIRDGALVASGETAAIRGDQSLESVFLELMDQEKAGAEG